MFEVISRHGQISQFLDGDQFVKITHAHEIMSLEESVSLVLGIPVPAAHFLIGLFLGECFNMLFLFYAYI